VSFWNRSELKLLTYSLCTFLKVLLFVQPQEQHCNFGVREWTAPQQDNSCEGDSYSWKGATTSQGTLPFFFGVGRAVGVVKAVHCFNLPFVGEVTWLFEAILLKWCSVLLMDIKRRKNIKQQKYHLLSQINFNR
jgi:hypothetical protein